MTSDEFEVDATPCKTVQRPVFRAAIDTPEPRAAEVCEPGAELKPQQSEQPKDEIAVGGPKGRATKLMLDDRCAQIVDYLNKGVSKRSVAKILGCSPTTLYSWIRRRRISGR